MPDFTTAELQKLSKDPVWHVVKKVQDPVLPPLEDGQAWLILRMGGNMVWSVFTMFDIVKTEVEGKEVGLPTVEAAFEQLIFEKAKAVVKPDGSNLQPGFGGWLDRATSAEDPDRVTAQVDGFISRYTVLWGNGSTIGGSASLSGTGANLAQQNKALFAVAVTRPAQYEFHRVPGTATKLLPA